MKRLRLYADKNGESHVEDMTVDFSMVAYAPPAPAIGISSPQDAARYVMVRFAPDWESGLHPTPRRQLFVMLSGQLEGQASDGVLMLLEAGDVLLMEDVTGMGHRARVMGGREVHAMMVHLE